MSTKSRAVSAKGVEEYKTYITRAIPLSAVINCADNTGAKTLRIVQVTRAKSRLKRVPAASVGDHVVCVVKRGPPDLRKQTFGAVIVRQKYAADSRRFGQDCQGRVPQHRGEGNKGSSEEGEGQRRGCHPRKDQGGDCACPDRRLEGRCHRLQPRRQVEEEEAGGSVRWQRREEGTG